MRSRKANPRIIDANNDLLADIIHELIILFQDKLKKVYLFGSFARNEAKKDSDIDIMAIIDDTDLNTYIGDLSEVEIKILNKYDRVPSIITENYAMFTDNVNVIPLFKNITQEGLLLYAV